MFESWRRWTCPIFIGWKVVGLHFFCGWVSAVPEAMDCAMLVLATIVTLCCEDNLSGPRGPQHLLHYCTGQLADLRISPASSIAWFWLLGPLGYFICFKIFKKMKAKAPRSWIVSCRETRYFLWGMVYHSRTWETRLRATLLKSWGARNGFHVSPIFWVEFANLNEWTYCRHAALH